MECYNGKAGESKYFLKGTSKISFNSKEEIEVTLYYESVAPCLPAGRAASGPLCEPPAEGKFSGSDRDGAAFRHLSAPQSRPTSKVCNLSLARPTLFHPTFPFDFTQGKPSISLFLPNPSVFRALTFPHSNNCAR